MKLSAIIVRAERACEHWGVSVDPVEIRIHKIPFLAYA
jgi:hypothetical protein